MDFEDILSGIDHLKKEGKVNTDRIYIIGGSYGGFISLLAIKKTDIFKGVVAMFGISDWISFHGTSNLYDWDRIHYNQDPYLFDRFIKYSPL